MPLTLEERERIAYVEGRTEEASLLALAIDAENDAIDEMRHERDMAKEEESRLARENEDLQTAVENAEEKVLTLTSDLENVQDEIKALQTEIREKCLDLL